MDTLFFLVALLANALTAGRLIVYRRGLSRYRPGMSFLAWALIVCAGGQVIEALTNPLQQTPWWAAGFAAVIAVLVWRAKGNVANIMRCDHA